MEQEVDEREGPVPERWRATIEEIVASFVRGDRPLGAAVGRLRPVSHHLVEQCEDAVRAYGDVTLVPLPPETWDSSVATRRLEGGWQCLVDLWTAEEGRSDLVMEFDVDEEHDGPAFTLHLVYVP